MNAKKTKYCNGCKQWKPISEFHKTENGNYSEYRAHCKDCRNKRRNEYRRNNPERFKNEILRRTFGITLDEYRKILEKQKGVCAICGKPETSTFKGKLRHLSVDHNHETGQVRGLLCNDCNAAIGFFKDDIEILANAIKYLVFWSNSKDSRSESFK